MLGLFSLRAHCCFLVNIGFRLLPFVLICSIRETRHEQHGDDTPDQDIPHGNAPFTSTILIPARVLAKILDRDYTPLGPGHVTWGRDVSTMAAARLTSSPGRLTPFYPRHKTPVPRLQRSWWSARA